MTADRALAAAAALAGRLAELGETRLLLLRPGCPAQPLAARETDLPGIIVGAMSDRGAVLLAETLRIRIEIDASGPHPADARAAAILRLAEPGRDSVP